MKKKNIAMEEEILKEIVKECKNWKERLLVKLFPNTHIKAYHIGRIKSINYMFK